MHDLVGRCDACFIPPAHFALASWAYQTCYGRQTQAGWRYKQGYSSLGLMKQPRLAGLALGFKGFDFISVLQG